MFKNKDQFIAYTAARVLAGQAANPEKNCHPRLAVVHATKLYEELKSEGISIYNQSSEKSLTEDISEIVKDMPKK